MTTAVTTDSWKDQFEAAKSAPPSAGTILVSLDGKPVKVNIELAAGKAPFMYGICHLPCIVGQPVGWYARSTEDETNYGWKCILLPKARDRVIRARGIASPVVGVKSLKVIRESREGKSLLVEVHEL
jgi:hypothetical protein